MDRRRTPPTTMSAGKRFSYRRYLLKCRERSNPVGIKHKARSKWAIDTLSAAPQAAYVPKRLSNACRPEPPLQGAPRSFRFPGLPIRAHPDEVAIGHDFKDRRRQGWRNGGAGAQSIGLMFRACAGECRGARCIGVQISLDTHFYSSATPLPGNRFPVSS